MNECVALESNKIDLELLVASHTPRTRSLNFKDSTPLTAKTLPATFGFSALGALHIGPILTKS